MEFKFLTFFLLGMFLISFVSAYDESYKIYPDKVVLDKEILSNPDVFIDGFHIDKNGYRVYHLDSVFDFNENDKVKLYLPYSFQPDWINHINHKGDFVKRYYPNNWEWKYNCNREVEDCSNYLGNVILRVDKVDKGFGSNTFPIGVDGPQWSFDSNILLNNNSDYHLDEDIIFYLDNPSFIYSNLNLTYSTTYNNTRPNQFNWATVDFDNTMNRWLLFASFGLACFLLFIGLNRFASALLFIDFGIMLLGGIHFVFCLVVLFVSLLLPGEKK